MAHGFAFDLAHLLSGGMVLMSFLLLYQSRLSSLLRIYAIHALLLSLAVAWQAHAQGAPHLYITAVIALAFKAIAIPVALDRIVRRLGIHRELETVVGIGPTMLFGMGLVALSIAVMLPVTGQADPLAREDLAFALSVVLLGLLVMITRRNAVGQVVGFMAMENGLVPGRDRRQGHAPGGRDLDRLLDADRLHRDRHLPVPHPRALRHGRPAGARQLPG
jgi:hydrogenase-4 component E